MPNKKETWEKIAEDFKTIWNMPNCIGALDGKHIVIQAVPNSGSTFYNYKGTNSIVLMALVDAHRRFIYVDIGCNGRVSDGVVFDESTLSKYLSDSNNPLNIPAPKELPGRNQKMPYFIVADDAFPLKPFIMKPFPTRNLSERKRIYNYRQSRARINVENAFGILSSRFQIIRKPLQFNPSKVDLFVLTCCCLHNMLVKDDERVTDTNKMLQLSRNTVNTSQQVSRNIRDELADYFINEGSVSWQLNKI